MSLIGASPPPPLGELELLLLSTVLSLSEDQYGLAIRQELERVTGRDIAIGSVYRSLAGLERKGLIRSWTGEPTPVRGGRAKKYFEVTGEGAKTLQRTLRDLRTLTASLELRAEPA